MISIAVLDDYQRCAPRFADWDALDATVTFFSEPLPSDRLPEVLAGFDVLVLMRERTPLGASVLQQLPRLRLVVTTGMRNASLDVAYLREHGVEVCGTEAISAEAGVSPPTEIAWALIFAAVTQLPAEDRFVRTGRWQHGLPGRLAGRTLGLVGLGRLGAEMIGPARAFGMDVLAWSPNLKADRAAALGVRKVLKTELLAESDVVSIHLVLSDSTRGLITADDLAAMKSTAVLVNTARGPIVDEAALVDALRDGTIAGAGLDVYDAEPLPAGHPLRGLDNVVLSPHLGYVEESSLRRWYAQVVEDIAAFQAGSPLRTVNKLPRIVK
jgi:phosphoglycerate dehydrogenase-like enzyme